MSTLFIVATPIGNLEDLTLRAAKVLRSVSVVVAEDTRVTRKLLEHLEAMPKLISFHRRSTDRDVRRIADYLDDGDLALVSDAGTPGVNDPGQAIVAAAVERGDDVVPVPGPSAVMTALSISGFYADQFTSYGFLPANGGRRRRVLREISAKSEAAVVFETPHRLPAALADMVTTLGEREIVVCRELTKMYEEIWRGVASDAVEYFESPRGEFVIVVAPLARSQANADDVSPGEADSMIVSAAEELAGSYASRRDLVDAVASRTGLPRRQVYQVLHGRD